MELVDIKTQDYLEEDPELRGQKYVCLSFISPEDAIKRKEVYVFKEFTKHLGNDVTNMLNNLSIKFQDNEEVTDMVKSLLDRYDYLGSSTYAIYEEYENFIRQNGDDIDKQYHEENKFQTSIRGIKVRGAFETLGEAQNRAKQIQGFDKNFNVYVAQVGCWCPWDPNPDKLQSEFADTQLNTLMKKYVENQNTKNDLFEERKQKISKQEGGASSSSAEISASEALEQMKLFEV